MPNTRTNKYSEEDGFNPPAVLLRPVVLRNFCGGFLHVWCMAYRRGAAAVLVISFLGSRGHGCIEGLRLEGFCRLPPWT